jgi:hypothetical protein
MKISNDSLVRKSLSHFIKNPNAKEIIGAQLLPKVFKLQKDIIEFTPPPEKNLYPFTILFKFVKDRNTACGIIIQISFGNIRCANVLTRTMYDNLTRMFYLTEVVNENDRNDYVHDEYTREQRKLLQMLLGNIGILIMDKQSKKMLPSVGIDVERLINQLTRHHREILYGQMIRLKDAEKRNKKTPTEIKNVISGNPYLVDFFCVDKFYWEYIKISDRFGNLKELSEENDNVISTCKSKYPHFPPGYFLSQYSTMYKLLCEDVHPSLNRPSEFVSMDLENFIIGQNFNSATTILTLCEQLLHECWLVNKLYRLNGENELDIIFAELSTLCSNHLAIMPY